MKRVELEHIIRASSAITGRNQIVVVGSQAILAQFPHADGAVAESIEADVFTFEDSRDAELIDGSIGERSTFHQTFGYYAHGVAVETSTLPDGWRDRLVTVSNENTRGAVGLCLEANDVCVSKLIAGREKDLEYLRHAFKRGYANEDVVRTRLGQSGLSDECLALAQHRLTRLLQ